MAATDPLSEFRLDGDVAVVTGGASGIGHVVATALAAVGARVVSFDLAASGDNAYKVDVTDESQVREAFADVVARHGRVDVLFNNAGIAIRQPTTELTLEDWNKVVAVNMTRALAVEWASQGIRVNAIAPTWVRTPLTRGITEKPELVRRIEQMTPMGRFAEPGEIVGAVVFLASRASAMVTGHVLAIDGGFLAQ